MADYFAINVSSPNTQGLRTLQRSDALAGIIEPPQEERERLVTRHGKRVPLLIKFHRISTTRNCSPWRLRCGAMRWTADCYQYQHSLAGFEAEGTHPMRPRRRPEWRTGCARSPWLRWGAPRSAGTGFPIIGVGGLMSAEDVRERRDAGANLLQLYTGFVYGGPTLLTRSLHALSQ